MAGMRSCPGDVGDTCGKTQSGCVCTFGFSRMLGPGDWAWRRASNIESVIESVVLVRLRRRRQTATHVGCSSWRHGCRTRKRWGSLLCDFCTTFYRALGSGTCRTDLCGLQYIGPSITQRKNVRPEVHFWRRLLRNTSISVMLKSHYSRAPTKGAVMPSN